MSNHKMVQVINIGESVVDDNGKVKLDKRRPEFYCDAPKCVKTVRNISGVKAEKIAIKRSNAGNYLCANCKAPLSYC